MSSSSFHPDKQPEKPSETPAGVESGVPSSPSGPSPLTPPNPCPDDVTECEKGVDCRDFSEAHLQAFSHKDTHLFSRPRTNCPFS